MLDENLPTYRVQPSSENPLNSLLYFTHNGSDPSPDYILKRPSPADSKNQYAVGLFDANYASVIYAEVLVKPDWTQPTLSAAEIRAQQQQHSSSSRNSPPPSPPAVAALVPESFSISLYNPDQTISIAHQPAKWNKADAWDFEVPQRTFRLPSASRVDQDNEAARAAELVPRVTFRWRRDGRLSKDMTCYLTGRSEGGRKSKEPDITVALFRGAKSDSTVCIYEPNMARVEVEDRKGLEVAFLLSAEVIRDLYLMPRQNLFNTAGAAPPTSSGAAAAAVHRTRTEPSGPAMSGALVSTAPATTTGPPLSQTQSVPPLSQAAATPGPIDAETRRLQAMVADEEQRERREREGRQQRDAEEQRRIKKMLEQEEKEKRRRDAEIDKETERLRREYGVTVPLPPPGGADTSPNLPPRPQFGGQQMMPPGPRPRPHSTGPPMQYAYRPPPPGAGGGGPPPPQQNGGGGGGAMKKFSDQLSSLINGPNSSSSSSRQEEERRKKMQKKRSVHF